MQDLAKLRRYHWALAMMFAIQGATAASTIARQAAFQSKFSLSTLQWASLLFINGLGSVLAYPIVYWVLQRWGIRRAIQRLALSFVLTLGAVALAPTLQWLFVTFFVQGVLNSAMNAAVNRQGAQLEAVTGKRVLGSLHGCYYLGLFVCAATASGATAYQIPLDWQLLGFGGALLVCVAGLYRQLMPNIPARVPVKVSSQVSEPGTPSGASLGIHLGLLAAGGALIEAAIQGWGPFFVTQQRHLDASIAAMGLASFSFAMMVGRFLMDYGARRLGATRWLRGGALLSASGALLIIATSSKPLMLAGFAIIGLGQAALIPMLYSAVGRIGQTATVNLSSLAATGSLISPILFGELVKMTGTVVTVFIVLTGLFGMITGFAYLVGRHAPPD